MEIWKDIQGYEGLYQVSNLGQVKSLAKFKGTNYKQFIAERIMKQKDNGFGYLTVGIRRSGKSTTTYIHRLVAQAFIPNPDNLPEVNHIDGNKLNNAADNLEWCDRAENERHAYKSGLKKVGEGNVLSKKIAQYTLDGVLVKTYPNARFVKKELGYEDSVIRRCARRVIETVYGFKWQYI